MSSNLILRMATITACVLALYFIYRVVREKESVDESMEFVWNKKLFSPSNWFGPSPEGSWSETTKGRVSELVTYLGIGVIVFSLWIAANMKNAEFVGIFYAVFMVFYAFAWVAELAYPGWAWIAFLDFGEVKKWSEGILFGIGVAFIVIMTQPLINSALHLSTGGLHISLMQSNIFKRAGPIVAVLSTAVVAPVAESGFFNALLLPTFVEDIGIVPGIIVVSFLFAMFHLYAYSVALPALISAFIFMSLASLLTLHQRAIVGAVVAHMFINFLAVV